MAKLHLVSTPIGNLSDLTLRARETLASVGRVYAEDTRRTRILLDHVGAKTPLASLHAHNEASRTKGVLERLAKGEDVALASDAGTPLISDPGHRLVRAVIEAGHAVIPVPGPSALLAALVVSGLPADRFAFLGFPPRKGRARREFLLRVDEGEETTVLFESPARLAALLRELAAHCGPERRVAVAREVTKIHEDVFRGTIEAARRYYDGGPPKGEVTLVVEGGGRLTEGSSPERGRGAGEGEEEPFGWPEPEISALDRKAVEALAQVWLEEGAGPSRAARDVARRLGVPRRVAYRIVQSLRGRQSMDEVQ